MSRRRRQPSTGCYYCGRPTQGERVCPSCTDLYDHDPLGRPAREPLSEHELGLPARIGERLPDQWREA